MFYVSDLMKQSRPKFHPAPIEFLAYPDNKNICVVECINDYLERTANFRIEILKRPILLSYAE